MPAPLTMAQVSVDPDIVNTVELAFPFYLKCYRSTVHVEESLPRNEMDILKMHMHVHAYCSIVYISPAWSQPKSPSNR